MEHGLVLYMNVGDQQYHMSLSESGGTIPHDMARLMFER